MDEAEPDHLLEESEAPAGQLDHRAGALRRDSAARVIVPVGPRIKTVYVTRSQRDIIPDHGAVRPVGRRVLRTTPALPALSTLARQTLIDLISLST
jgi:hypothetical protein